MFPEVEGLAGKIAGVTAGVVLILRLVCFVTAINYNRQMLDDIPFVKGTKAVSR